MSLKHDLEIARKEMDQAAFSEQQINTSARYGDSEERAKAREALDRYIHARDKYHRILSLVEEHEKKVLEAKDAEPSKAA